MTVVLSALLAHGMITTHLLAAYGGLSRRVAWHIYSYMYVHHHYIYVLVEFRSVIDPCYV